MRTSENIPFSADQTTRITDSILSVPLQRAVQVEVILPPGYQGQASLPQERLPQDGLPLLLLNDGQDLGRLRFQEVLDSLYEQQLIRPLVVVAIHAGDRIQEYGTAARADYMKRGSKAALYTDFVLTELLPYMHKHYQITNDPAQSVFAGFSLGGLAAFDIVFHNPEKFSRVGVFSGSFWWRQKAFSSAYDDYNDRIMHVLVRNREWAEKPHLSFWLQTGTLDETSDRNNNGIIDSIDDTLDLIAELEAKGYQRNQHIRYVEIDGGRHDQETWSAIMPDFLTWAFGR